MIFRINFKNYAKKAKKKHKFKKMTKMQKKQKLYVQFENSYKKGNNAKIRCVFWKIILLLYCSYFLHFKPQNSYKKSYNLPKIYLYSNFIL